MDLRLFPLNTVLFPNMRLPLHIFEERYKIMIRECIEEDAPFGVILVKSGDEVGDTPVPFEVGTTARIIQVEYLDDGRLNIFTMGHERFRTIAITTTQPYLRAEVTMLEQLPVDEAGWSVMPRARQMFDDYFKTYFSIADQWVREVYLPPDPADAADYIAARCDVPPEAKQRWLEELDPEARLRMELELISEALPEMHGRLVAHLRQKTTGFGVMN